MNYEDMEIKREHSRYPKGLKHKSKDTMIENSLFDLEYIGYKLKGIFKGATDGKTDNTGSEAKSNSTPKEVL